MSALRRGWVVMFLAAASGPALARPISHVAKAGESFQSLAAEFYGNRSLALPLAEANGLHRGAHLKPGQTIRLPSVSRYRVKKGDTFDALAARLLGDKRRASYLAFWSGLHASDKPREGADLLVPVQVTHVATASESLASLAKSYFNDQGQAKFIANYNFKLTSILFKGERLIVPLPRMKVRAVHLATASQPPVQPGKAIDAGSEAKKREDELAARVAARIRLAEQAYRDGNYNEVPSALTKLLSEEDPSEAQLIEIHRLLAFAYVALGTEEVAVEEFREVLERDPDAKLDAKAVSPKIRAAFERAKQGP